MRSSALRCLVAFQIALVLAMAISPAGALAADPSPSASIPDASTPPDPTATPDPTASPDATPTPTVTPDPTAAPPDPTAEPTPEAAADPTAAVTPDAASATPDSSASPEASATPDPSASPDVSPTPAPSAAPTRPFVVTFDAGVSAADQADAIDAAAATITDTIAVLRIRAVNASDAAVVALRADPRVSSVEADRSRAAEATPDDSAYGDQWSLAKIGWDQVYGTALAGTAVVAVLDTGVDAGQPDLTGKLVAGTSLLATQPTTDPNGHGTEMAGIVAAGTNNGIGIAGVGYGGVKVMPITVLGADGTGRDSDVIEGLVWAADHGADVALMAFSAPGYSSALQAAVDYAWSKGVVLVAATGNDGSSAPAFPAGDRGVVGVSSTNSSDDLASSSNYGTDTFIAAPGVGIPTLSVSGGVTTVSGTSAAAAHVAGAAALLRAKDAALSNGVVVGRLARTADAAGTAAETGNGRLNLPRAFDDTSTAAVKPAGASPVGDVGPVVGADITAQTNFQSLSVGPQSPASITPRGSATFSVQIGLSGAGS